MWYSENWIMMCLVKVPKSDEEYNLRVPRDMAYIFSGAYIPLSCKLIEQVWKIRIIYYKSCFFSIAVTKYIFLSSL